MTLEEYTDKIDDFYRLSSSEQIKYFAYYLLLICKNDGFKASEIKILFEQLHIIPYSNISKYLNDKTKGKVLKKIFIKRKDVFYLLKNVKESIENELHISKPKIAVSKNLNNLSSKIVNREQNNFYQETLKCLGVESYRATIIMSWNLALDHLYEFILNNKITDFNLVLAKNTDKRIKITSITSKDDFNEIPENKFIEFCRSSKIISNDIRKILEVSLGIRNSAAHPSNIVFTESKTVNFVEDLILNILLKYKK